MMKNSWSGLYHSECKDDEVFLTNITPAKFDYIEYDSKRMGKQAYDIDGIAMESTVVPVLVNRSEYEAKTAS